MRRNGLTVALAALLLIGATELALATFAGPASPSGPWPRVTGNDTGGIIPYSPAIEGAYEGMAQDSVPITHHRLNQRQRRDRGRIGA